MDNDIYNSKMDLLAQRAESLGMKTEELAHIRNIAAACRLYEDLHAMYKLTPAQESALMLWQCYNAQCPINGEK